MKDNLTKKQKKLLQSSKSRASLKQFCEAHNCSIDDFLELQQHWYQKYKEAGYKDYEHTDSQTGHVSSYCDSGIGEIKKFLQKCANNKQDWLQTDSAIRKQTIHSLITIFVDELTRQRVCLWKKRSNLRKQLRSNNFNNQDNQNSSPSLSHNKKTNGQGIRASLTKKLNKTTTQINNLTDLIQVFSVYSEELHNRVIVHREHNKRYPQYKKSYKEVKRLIIKGRKMMPDTIRSLLTTNKQTNPLNNQGLVDNLKKLNFKVASDNNNNHNEKEKEKDKREEIEEMFKGLNNTSCWEFTDVTINGNEE